MFAEYKATDFLSDKTKKDHLKLLDGYEKNSAELEKKLAKADPDKSNAGNSDFRFAVDNLRFNYNAQLFHIMYFRQITAKPTTPSAIFKNWLDVNIKNKEATFKSYDDWKEALFATAKASQGWVVFGFDPFANQLKIIPVDSHDIGLPPAFFPLLVLDVWEHAYVGDFGTDRGAYVKAWFKHIDWDHVMTMAEICGRSRSDHFMTTVTAGIYNQLHILGYLKG